MNKYRLALSALLSVLCITAYSQDNSGDDNQLKKYLDEKTSVEKPILGRDTLSVNIPKKQLVDQKKNAKNNPGDADKPHDIKKKDRKEVKEIKNSSNMNNHKNIKTRKKNTNNSNRKKVVKKRIK